MNVYMYDMRRLKNEEEYKRLFDKASVTRQQKACKGRKFEHVAAAAVTDAALSKYGLYEKDVDIRYGELGKPYIKNNIAYYNISHSGDYAICAVHDKEVGIDIQKIGNSRLSLAKRFYTETEYMNILSQDSDKNQIEMFYRIWALKESFVKAIGVGTNLDFTSFEITCGEEAEELYDCHVRTTRDNPVEMFELKKGGSTSVRQDYNDKKYGFIEKIMPGYRIAVCYEL